MDLYIYTLFYFIENYYLQRKLLYFKQVRDLVNIHRLILDRRSMKIKNNVEF